MTQEQIKNKVLAIKQELSEAEKEVIKLAEQKDIYIRTDISYSFRKYLVKHFPVLQITEFSCHYVNGVDSVAREVFEIVNNPEYTILRHFDIQEVKNNTIKLNKSALYWFYNFSYIYGEELKPETIKEYQNGYCWIKLSDEDMKIFLDCYNFENKETTQLKEMIDDKLKADYKKWISQKSANKYYFIHQLGEKHNISTRFVNFDLLINLLKG